MKQYIKHNFTKVLLFFCFLSLPYITVAQDPAPYTLETQIKIKSLPKTAQDALLMYREIGATPQQIAVPYVFLSLLGHPSYPTLSPNQNLCIFIYKSPTDSHRKYILMAKLQPNNTLKPLIQSLGWATQEHQDWTLFAKNPSDFPPSKDLNSLISYATEPLKTDIEITTHPSLLSLTQLKPDQDLQDALNNLNKAVLNINLPEGQILIDASFNQKQSKPHLSTWLEKNANRWGLHTTIMNQTSKDSKVHITLDRKDIANFINQLRAKVLATETAQIPQAPQTPQTP